MLRYIYIRLYSYTYWAFDCEHSLVDLYLFLFFFFLNLFSSFVHFLFGIRYFYVTSPHVKYNVNFIVSRSFVFHFILVQYFVKWNEQNLYLKLGKICLSAIHAIYSNFKFGFSIQNIFLMNFFLLCIIEMQTKARLTIDVRAMQL